MKCLSCGTEKDPKAATVYPYPEDECFCDDPIPDLVTVECQSTEKLADGFSDFRMAVMCHECWHRLCGDDGIDMWIGQKCWESLSPQTPFSSLPKVKKKDDWVLWGAEHYQ